jgi:hypothetical protein
MNISFYQSSILLRHVIHIRCFTRMNVASVVYQKQNKHACEMTAGQTLMVLKTDQRSILRKPLLQSEVVVM